MSQPQFPRPSCKQLAEELAKERIKGENLQKRLDQTNIALEEYKLELEKCRAERDEYKNKCDRLDEERRAHEAAAHELLEVLREFCIPSRSTTPSNALVTPKLGNACSESSWAELEQQVASVSAKVLGTPQRVASLDDSGRSPFRRSAARRLRLSFGGKRDPVGSLGEVVAQIARDRNARHAKTGNQENTPDKCTPAASQAMTEHPSPLSSVLPKCAGLSRSPLSSLHGSTGVEEQPHNVVCIHTNMLANMTGDNSSSARTSTDGTDPSSPNRSRWHPSQTAGSSAPPPPSPKDSSTEFAEAVLADIVLCKQPAGLKNLIASVVNKAKCRAAQDLQGHQRFHGNEEQTVE